MRARTPALLVSAALFALAASPAVAQERHAFIVVDSQTNQVLYESNAQERRFPASITKVMTIYMIFEAVEQGRLSWDSSITFSRNAAGQPPTKMGIRAGGTMTVEDAVNALIIRSANDVATAVAENLAGSEAAFARQMTERARALGMAGTQFRNASGLPDRNQFSTAEDLARLSIAIRRDFPQHFHMFSRTQFTFNGTVINGHNRLLGTVDGVDGLKTGFTRASGYNLAATAARGNQRVVTVVLGGATSAARNAEVENLLETGFYSLGVQRYVHGVATGSSAGLADLRDAGDLDALATELPVGLNPGAPVVLAGLPRSGRGINMPASPTNWSMPVNFAATTSASQPAAAPAVRMAASDMAALAVEAGNEAEAESGEPAVVQFASNTAPLPLPAVFAAAEPQSVAPVLVALAPPESAPASVPVIVAETVQSQEAPVMMEAATDAVVAPSAHQPVMMAETSAALSDQVPVAEQAPSRGMISEPVAVQTVPAPTQFAEAWSQPVQPATTASAPVAEPAVVMAEVASSASEASLAAVSFTVPVAEPLAAVQMAVVEAAPALEPWIDPPATSEPVVAQVQMALVEAPSPLGEGPAIDSVNLDTSVLPTAQTGIEPAVEVVMAEVVMPSPALDPVKIAPEEPLAAEALSPAEQLRREVAEREALRMAAITAQEASRAAEAQAAARARQLAERQARDQRERQMAAQRAREAREQELAERRDREQAAAAEVANQRRIAEARGSSAVQIGAFRSEREAQSALRAFTRFAPSVARSEVSRVETRDGVLFRARFNGLASNAARALCSQITGGGGQCQIIGN